MLRGGAQHTVVSLAGPDTAGPAAEAAHAQETTEAARATAR
jgi:hypothetical protein